LEYFGLDPQSPSADKSLKWYSLLQQQIEGLKDEHKRKVFLETFRALHYYKDNKFAEHIRNPLFEIDPALSPTEHLSMKLFFGPDHFDMFHSLLTLVKIHRLLITKRSEYDNHKSPSRQYIFCTCVIDIPLKVCERTLMYLIDRFESKYCSQTLPSNTRCLSESPFPLYQFYETIKLREF
jgi:hypothetical protein